MQVTKTLIAAAGNAGGASGALYEITDSTKSPYGFNSRQARIDSSDNILFTIDSRTTGYTPEYLIGLGKIDQDGNTYFYKEFNSTTFSYGSVPKEGCMDLDSSGNMHLIYQAIGVNGIWWNKFSGSNGNCLDSTSRYAGYTNMAWIGVIKMDDGNMALFAKQDGTPNSGIVKYTESSDPYNGYSSGTAYYQSSLNALYPSQVKPVSSWANWHFTTPYTTLRAIVAVWSGSGSGPTREQTINLTNNHSITYIGPTQSASCPHNTNLTYTIGIVDHSSLGLGGQSDGFLMRSDYAYSTSDMFRVFNKYNSTGEWQYQNSFQRIIADHVTGSEYVYVSGYTYDPVTGYIKTFIICFDSSTGDIVNSVMIKGSSFSVFSTSDLSIDSEGNVFASLTGRPDAVATIIKLPSGLEITDTTIGAFTIEQSDEIQFAFSDSVTSFGSINPPTSGWGYSSSSGTPISTSKTLSVTATTI